MAPRFIAEQGDWLQAIVEVVGSWHDIETAKVGSAAVTVLRGEHNLSQGAS